MASVDLLGGGDDEHLPNLENRVAFQWRDGQDTLAHLHATRRDELVLRWLAEAVRRGDEPRAALDVGCAYGNYALMLNAMLGRDASIRIRGVDLHEPHLAYGQTFAREVPGYANCEFSKADVVEGLPFDDATFDAVCLADVLEHLEDPVAALRELRRVTKPGGSIVVSTPLSTSLFKTAARVANALTRGRVYRGYYAGKGSQLDEHGQPVMEVDAGHDHISEMRLSELRRTAERAGLTVAEVEPMSVMSGSRWFDEHPFLLSGFMFVEALHAVLRKPSWAHSVVLRLTR
jgi:ubiquinone/menaquinone biosynthesis C-methylase UbiE